MSLSTKPTLVFVHGAFHGPDCFDAVISILSSAGFPCVDNLKLPGTGCSTPITFEEDVAALRAILVRLIEEEGKDCVLIMHSYSGVCGPQATKGLGKRERGNKAGVSRMLFITCNIPLEGQSHLDQLLGYHKDKGLPIPGLTKVQNGLATWAAGADLLYSDLPRETHKSLMDKLQNQSNLTLSTPVTYSAWSSDIPKWYLIAEQDKVLTAEYQEYVATLGGDKMEAIERISAGHYPFMSQPEKVADFIARGATRS